ncbi:MAG: hypothetical protein L0154_18780 [Chloroflexi bacterium]|nr:hypothetical protein [Chloroflexota bacterium]
MMRWILLLTIWTNIFLVDPTSSQDDCGTWEHLTTIWTQPSTYGEPLSNTNGNYLELWDHSIVDLRTGEVLIEEGDLVDEEFIFTSSEDSHRLLDIHTLETVVSASTSANINVYDEYYEIKNVLRNEYGRTERFTFIDRDTGEEIGTYIGGVRASLSPDKRYVATLQDTDPTWTMYVVRWDFWTQKL